MDEITAENINTTEELPADDMAPAPENETDSEIGEISFSDEETDDNEVKPKKPKKKRGCLIAILVIIGIILALIVYGVVSVISHINESKKNMYKDVAVERRTISKAITGSSKIEPNDSYEVMTIKSGDIIADYFKEGDTVKKGDKLYQFDDQDARRSLQSAQNAVTKADQAYIDAVKQKAQTASANSIATKASENAITKTLNSLSDAKDSFGDQYIRSDISGKVKSVSVKEGETVAMGAAVATVYEDSYMKIRLPFNDYDAEDVHIGDAAEVTVTGSGDKLFGVVTEKSGASSATDSHTIVVYATIEVSNPGALTENDRGSAVVGEVACSDTAKFEYKNQQKLTAKTAGTLKSLNIAEGDYVSVGTELGYIEGKSVSTALSNAELGYDDAVLNLQKQVLQNDTYAQDSAIKTAQLALDDARLKLKQAEKDVKDFIVEAPIEGKVVKKTTKAGDTRDSTNSKDALCIIYDLSVVKLNIEVDETEIALVKTGLKAKVKADAVEGEFEGEVTNVPVNGVNENGVTTYTVEVKIKNYGTLLPGMNVDAEIVVDEADNVLAVPVNSVNRGDIVFVKDNGQKRSNDVTDVINSKKQKDGDKSSEPVKAPEGVDVSSIPANTEIPEGYVALKVTAGLNDNDYIEIKSGLSEGDMVRTLNTENAAAFGSSGDDMMAEMQQNRNQQMRQVQTGSAPAGGGGMSGGGMSGGGGGSGSGSGSKSGGSGSGSSK